MAKKKEKKVINIDEVNIEIDYDKLADAIVNANEKQSQQYSMSREWMKFLIYPVFGGMAIVTAIVAICCIVYGATSMYSGMNNLTTVAIPNLRGFLSEFSVGGLIFCIGLFIGSISFATMMTAKEIDKEKDRNYVAAMFSNVVALVALVISLVALIKG